MTLKKCWYWLAGGSFLVLLAVWLAFLSGREKKPEKRPSERSITDLAATVAEPVKPGPAVDVVRAAAEVQEKLTKISGVKEGADRLALLKELVQDYKGLAAPALPFLVAILPDRTPKPVAPGAETGTEPIPPTSPRLEAIAMLGGIGTDEAVDLLVRALQEDLASGETGELPALFMAMGATRNHRAAVELCRLLDQYRDQPGDVRDRLVDFFARFRLRNWPVTDICTIVENSRETWETLVLDPDPFGPSFTARDLLNEQLLTLIGVLQRSDTSGDDKALALDLLRRLSGKNLPADPERWEKWYRENRN
jgi:hypothetical protein